MFLFVLGRQPEIGFAELRAVFGAENVLEISAAAPNDGQAAAAGWPRNLAGIFAEKVDEKKFSRLGSTVKIAKVFAKIPDKESLKLADFADEISRNFADEKGKITLGFSSETREISAQNLDEIAKKAREKIVKNGDSFREISREKNEEKLNSASVFHNKLAGVSAKKAEIIFAKSKITKAGASAVARSNSPASVLWTENSRNEFANSYEFLLAKTVFVQNITSYTFRDRARPKRDAKVGMLPPKLAQTIINLATENCEIRGKILLDPFVGTGVILQEAALMGMKVFGTDLEPRMIDFTRENLDFVSRKFGREFREIGADRDFSRKLEVGNATDFQWDFRGAENEKNAEKIREKTDGKSNEKFAKNDGKNASIFPDFVAGETYLGRAYAQEPSAENLRENIGNVNKILTEFLKNLAKHADEKTGICVAVPAWFSRKNGREKTIHLPLIKELENLGFSRVFGTENLIYHRENQVVGRELLCLQKSAGK